MTILLPESSQTAAQSLTPRQIVAELDKHVVGQAAAKRLRLTCSIADGERRVMVDARRIRQVLLNVFSNAVKFSPEGATIAVAASPEGAWPAGYFVPGRMILLHSRRSIQMGWRGHKSLRCGRSIAQR